ncbi:GyrI-like domain-containing protein [Bacillus sp. JJ1773]|uniref:GyrI-like domain-containing protein n=1 Tax=Bacillus sp. JJ1773 TaxID=3122965 RepID=UPI002FFE9174
MMECKRVKKDFKVVAMKNRGAFANYGSEVPKLAQQFMSRAGEIQNHSKTEIALYEPKRDENHLEGYYYVGMVVYDALNEVPSGMEYIEISQEYVTTRGRINDVGDLHLQLNKWSDENGYQKNLGSYIIEIYHQIENDIEEVEIYIPIHS